MQMNGDCPLLSLLSESELAEQKEIVAQMNSVDSLIQVEIRDLGKLALLESGLMSNLLIGRVRTPAGKHLKKKEQS